MTPQEIQEHYILLGTRLPRNIFTELTQNLTHHFHNAAVERGWWTNLTTGEPLKRNVGEMFALMGTELNEAVQADEDADEHLPDFRNELIEIADLHIRLFDMSGKFFPYLPAKIGNRLETLYGFGPLESYVSLTGIQGLYIPLFNAFEHYRKGKIEEASNELARLFTDSFCFYPPRILGVAVAAKYEYNLRRADHTPQARLADGGKKI